MRPLGIRKACPCRGRNAHRGPHVARRGVPGRRVSRMRFGQLQRALGLFMPVGAGCYEVRQGLAPGCTPIARKQVRQRQMV